MSPAKPASNELHAAPENGESFRLLVETVQDYAIFLLDPGGHVTSWNPGAEHIKGYSSNEILGRHISIFYTPEDQKANRPQELLEVAAREGQVSLEGLRVRKDGSLFWATVVVTALRNPDGSLRGFAKITHDLTERRLAEQELRYIQESLESAEEQAQLGSWELDVGTQRGRWSKQMFRFFGLEPASEAPSFELYLELIHPEDRHILQEVLGQMSAGEEPAVKEFRTNPARLPLRHFSPTWRVTRDEQGQPVKFEGTMPSCSTTCSAPTWNSPWLMTTPSRAGPAPLKCGTWKQKATAGV